MFISVNAPTPRLARRRSAANYARTERANGRSTRAAYSARRANRANRQAARVTLNALTR